jgi:hypothetical protein
LEAVTAKSAILCVLSAPKTTPCAVNPEGYLIALPSSVNDCPAGVTNVLVVDVPIPVIVELCANFPK